MTNTSTAQSKIIAAFKGCVINFTSVKKDENLESFPDPESVKLLTRVIDIVEKCYPGQTDGDLVNRLLIEALKEWSNNEKIVHDQSQLEEAGMKFFEAIETSFKPRKLFLPIEGLIVINHESLPLGNCQLHRNSVKSSFLQILEQSKKYHPKDNIDWAERVKSYFTYESTAHPNQMMNRGIKEATLALDILRLYISSYFDVHHEFYKRRMGLSGSLPIDERSHIFYIDPSHPIEDRFPGQRDSLVVQRDFEIDHSRVHLIKAHGLERINYLVRLIGHNHQKGNKGIHEIARRLLISITWFAKATIAKSITDSYLMYAIAIEGLLTEGRTPQETYFTQIAALITCDTTGCSIYPLDGRKSQEFEKRLEETTIVSDRFDIIRKRVSDLFKYRNHIVHGAVLGDEIEGDFLCDLETIVRNSILSFVMRKWDTFDDFKVWIKESVRNNYFIPKK